MIRFARQQSKRLIEFGKRNSGALIIGVSLIIGLNFERFTNYAAETYDAINRAIYRLSGQADADVAKYRQEVAQREQEAAQRAKEGQARIEHLRVEAAAWQEFLASVRTKFSQIALVKNSYGGDYSCLRIRKAEEVSAYQVRDNISDDFVQWLNGNLEKAPDPWEKYNPQPAPALPRGFEMDQPKQSINQPLLRRDWKYDDLQDFATQPYMACSSAKDLWRANRYKKRID